MKLNKLLARFSFWIKNIMVKGEPFDLKFTENVYWVAGSKLMVDGVHAIVIEASQHSVIAIKLSRIGLILIDIFNFNPFQDETD